MSDLEELPCEGTGFVQRGGKAAHGPEPAQSISTAGGAQRREQNSVTETGSFDWEADRTSNVQPKEVSERLPKPSSSWLLNG